MVCAVFNPVSCFCNVFCVSAFSDGLAIPNRTEHIVSDALSNVYIYIVWGWGAASYPRVLGEEYNTSSTMMDSTVETTPALVPMLDSFDNCGFLAKLWPLRFGHIFG